MLARLTPLHRPATAKPDVFWNANYHVTQQVSNGVLFHSLPRQSSGNMRPLAKLRNGLSWYPKRCRP